LRNAAHGIAVPLELAALPVVRIITALALAAIVLGSLWLLPVQASTGLFLLFIAAAAYEWATLAGIRPQVGRLSYALFVFVAAVAAWQMSQSPHVLESVLLVGCGWWCLATAWVVSYQTWNKPVVRNALTLSVLGLVVLLPALCALAYLLTLSPAHVLGLFGIVWSADILAYAGGRRFGRKRLASRVSPGKTWEGLVTAIVGTLAIAFTLIQITEKIPIAVFWVIVMPTLFASVIGDLFESLLKRLRGIKDSGASLPGHGGVLDRVDSMLAAAPVFALTLHTMGYK
jgi:phosphatidate cytidylyltransferase